MIENFELIRGRVDYLVLFGNVALHTARDGRVHVDANALEYEHLLLQVHVELDKRAEIRMGAD